MASGCRPGPGVYGTRVELSGVSVRGATFIGRAVTFQATAPTIETHLLDWNGRSLYGRRLELEFVTRVRGTVQFPSPRALAAQIERDLATIRQIGRASCRERV